MALKDTVHYLAALSRLSLTEEELLGLTRDMESIIGLMDGIKEVDTTGLLGTESIVGLQNIFRSDEPVIKNNRGEILKNAPVSEADSFAVPKMME